MTDLTGYHRASDWARVRATVAGFGVSGFAAADNLTHLGATVTALDEGTSETKSEQAQLLEVLGATVRLGEGATAALPETTDLLVVSPGWPLENTGFGPPRSASTLSTVSSIRNIVVFSRKASVEIG